MLTLLLSSTVSLAWSIPTYTWKGLFASKVWLHLRIHPVWPWFSKCQNFVGFAEATIVRILLKTEVDIIFIVHCHGYQNLFSLLVPARTFPTPSQMHACLSTYATPHFHSPTWTNQIWAYNLWTPNYCNFLVLDNADLDYFIGFDIIITLHLCDIIISS